MTKKGLLWYIFGIPLIILQILSIIGGINNQTFPLPLSFSSFSVFLYDLISWVSYLLVGIIGMLFVLIGAKSSHKKKTFEKYADNCYDTNSHSQRTHTKNKQKLNRYCNVCGSLIDPDTGRCAGCGKQYLHLTIKQYAVILSTICTILLITTTIYYVRSENYKHKIEKLNESISEIENTITRKDSTIANLKAENAMYLTQIEKLKTKNEDLSGKLSFYDSHVVFIPNYSNLYHKYDCFLFALVKETTPFLAYNTEQAKSKGYSPCLMCCQ